MSYKLFVGVIKFVCPTQKNIIETTILVASDWTEAEEKTRKYAVEFALETNIPYLNIVVFVQAHHANNVAACVEFVTRQGKNCFLTTKHKFRRLIDRKKVSLNLGNGKTIEI